MSLKIPSFSRFSGRDFSSFPQKNDATSICPAAQGASRHDDMYDYCDTWLADSELKQERHKLTFTEDKLVEKRRVIFSVLFFEIFKVI